MRLVSFRDGAGAAYGVITEAGVHPASPELRRRFPDLKSLLAADALNELGAVASSTPVVPERFDPVVPNAGKILCIGVNYLAHIREMGREQPSYPTVFARFADSLVGHREPLVKPRISQEYDYEGELAVVIGRTGRHVTVAHALDYVAGYTCFLDGSVRDWQRHTSQFLPGKNFPGSGSCGPWLTTADEIDDPGKLHLTTRINGELMQSAPIGDLCFDVKHIVAYCSGFCRLEPGDIITTGTPSGVGFARQPPRWLEAGDEIEVEVSGVGVLANVVEDERL